MQKDLDKLKVLIEKYKTDSKYGDCFLDIINRSFDENIISLILKYVMQNDNEFLQNLLNVNNIVVDEVTTEYVISSSRRIDILVKTRIDNENAIIVIENKINSYEHSDQCQHYYEYIEKEFKNYKRYYIFLKPEYSFANTSCKYFKTMTYNDVYDAIRNDSDIYIQDFKKEIKNNLVVKPMNELENFILDNYKILKETIDDLTKRIDKFFVSELMPAVNDELGLNTEKVGNSYRFYNQKEWWSKELANKDDMYYFYIELVFGNNNIHKISLQQVVKRYSRNENSRISRFMHQEYPSLTPFDGLWYVIDKKQVNFDNILSPEWKQKMIEQSIDVLKRYKDKQELLVEKFKNI